MRKLLILLIILISIENLSAQTKGRYCVEFYNLENLFDTINTPNVNDEEFTPVGAKRWTGKRYVEKLKRVDNVFYTLAKEVGTYPVFIGVSELENRSVLEDLISQEKMGRVNYGISHYDSPDARGVDVALLFRADLFKYEGSRPLPVPLSFKTRDILETWGTIDGEKFCVYVCHWPSRRNGSQASAPNRIAAAKVVRNAVDSLQKNEPSTKIIIMGDMNDDPVDPSIYDELKAVGNIDKLEEGCLYNPFYDMFKKGIGSLAYDDAWNLFDNIIVSANLVKSPSGSLKITKLPKCKYYGNILNRPFLCGKSGQYKGYPLRTYVGNTYQSGYSDHFSTYILLEK